MERKGFRTIQHAVVWNIWRVRNDRIFNNKIGEVDELVEAIKVLSWRWWLSRMNSLVCMFYEWLWDPKECLLRQGSGSCCSLVAEAVVCGVCIFVFFACCQFAYSSISFSVSSCRELCQSVVCLSSVSVVVFSSTRFFGSYRVLAVEFSGISETFISCFCFRLVQWCALYPLVVNKIQLILKKSLVQFQEFSRDMTVAFVLKFL